MTRTITWLSTLKSAEGKTITKVIEEEYGGDIKQVVLLFKDDTALCLDIDRGYDGDVGIVVDQQPYLEDTTALSLGLTTQQELVAKQQREQDAENRRKSEMERAEFERLKAKFG